MDVVDLREFYASPLGQASRRLIARRLRSRWNNLAGATILGLGYATPYLDVFRQEARAVLGFMPAEQGVVHWPAEGPSATALVDEVELPVLDRIARAARRRLRERVVPSDDERGGDQRGG